ncbi:MAG: hypothetical protein CL454_00825 [Acidimicrobiaceae bacterium]|nr:hypothetical protein [Acidimicrobiaceae bacterium]|tara:strand:- start:1618 stop:1893 length:276 start_codon:yes stop_codon:yes gene_type:complete
MKGLNILDAFTPGVPLGVRTLRKRLPAKHSAIMAAIYIEIEAGRLRRVNPEEVGSNKFHAVMPSTWDMQKLRGSSKMRNFQRQQANIFALV